MAGRIPLSAAGAFLVAILAVPSCQRASSKDEAREAGDPYANGQRLAQATAKWPERWADTAELPACTALLEGTREAICSSAQSALAARKAARAEGEAGVLRRAAALALAAHRAAEELRRSGLEALAEQRKASPAASASAVPSAELSSAKAASSRVPSALASARHDHDSKRMHDNPHVDAITAYARTSRLGLRELAAYLQNGPLATRRRAFQEVTRLGREEPRWSGLRDIVSESALVEPDPELKRELRELTSELGRR